MIGICGVALDVDDTLYLERDYVRSGFASVDRWLVTQHGIEGVGAEAWRLFRDGVRGTTLGDALMAVVGNVSLLKACIQHYRQHKPNIHLLPDACELLDQIAPHLPIAVVTDGPAPSQWAKCQALGLLEIADRVIVTDDMGTSKPDPAVFDAAVSGWGIDPAQLVYVADNPTKDFIAPLELGWTAVRVRRPGGLHEALPTPANVREIGDLSALWQTEAAPC